MVTASSTSKGKKSFELNFNNDENEIYLLLSVCCNSYSKEIWETLKLKIQCFKKGSSLITKENKIELRFCPYLNIKSESHHVENKHIVSIEMKNMHNLPISLNTLFIEDSKYQDIIW
jgi:hypothetical protein